MIRCRPHPRPFSRPTPRALQWSRPESGRSCRCPGPVSRNRGFISNRFSGGWAILSTGHLKVTDSNLPGPGRLVTCGERICKLYGIRLDKSIPPGTSGCQVEGLGSPEPRCTLSWGLVLAHAGIIAILRVHEGCTREKNTVFKSF